ncbi:hypothetical protein [Citrobacter portucalensis]|uniref:hypothetical protein n=1 Tax=Citrobacter portucalensis TaxID=1639133 RepID=UPI003977F4E4
MTTNHPAQGPVSLDRLHQIREHLQHDTQYSNGGNRAYILADVLKVIDGAIAAFGAEPVAYTEKCEITNMQATGLYLRGFPDNSQGRNIALYTAPPAPVVPTFDEWLELRGNKPLGWVKDAMRESYDACRAAMLQDEPVTTANKLGNSPVTPDGWKLVPVTAFPSQWAAGKKAFDSAGINKVDAVYKAMVAAAPLHGVKHG